jgi:hypothetical protein
MLEYELQIYNNYNKEQRLLPINNECIICCKANDINSIIVCDICEMSKCHYYCDGLYRIPDSLWKCYKCRCSGLLYSLKFKI